MSLLRRHQLLLPGELGVLRGEGGREGGGGISQVYSTACALWGEEKRRERKTHKGGMEGGREGGKDINYSEVYLVPTRMRGRKGGREGRREGGREGGKVDNAPSANQSWCQRG